VEEDLSVALGQQGAEPELWWFCTREPGQTIKATVKKTAAVPARVVEEIGWALATSCPCCPSPTYLHCPTWTALYGWASRP
jgi:hypothetical protein